MEFPGLLTNPPAVFANFSQPRRCDAEAMPVVVPIYKICKQQQGGDVDAKLLGNLRHAQACWRTHPPSHISFDHLAVTTHCSAPSSPLVVGRGRVAEASSFLAEEREGAQD